jgi:hypothetical protein
MAKTVEPTEEQIALAKAIVSEMAKRAASVKSPKRAAASRRNGKLGGRPRKGEV